MRDNIRPEIVLLAAEAGHEVLFTPPRYSDLQLIELFWANVKDEIGKQYSLSTTFSDVKERLDTEFQKLSSETGKSLIRRIIARVDKRIEYFLEEIEKEETSIGNIDDEETENSSDVI